MNHSLKTAERNLTEQAPVDRSANIIRTSPDWPEELVGPLRNVQRLLQEGKNEAALDLVHQTKSKSPWLGNAAGVCHLRLGKYQLAVDTFRRILVSGGVVLKEDSPDIFKLNFATALLLNNNFTGFISVTGEIKNQSLPELIQLRQAFAEWKSAQSVWRRILWSFGMEPKTPFALGFPPGSLG